jgi:hypothetical protein
MSRYQSTNWRDGTTVWPWHEMYRQWLSEAETQNEERKKCQNERQSLPAISTALESPSLK